ncbi:hypothetical protein Dsin_020487 [Dipteronia sinensis]|uniref:Endonuclease/exonuclease/phosphatase domain-containing protein n=1 Tax=Dipteronia sinensis TaxID=43782 RepID=A0AAE0E414_9ROSI|nr:hypothetical protein Dsin_020487 [Dipteronia sinensis]
MASDSDRSSDEMTSSYSEYEMEDGQLVQFGKSVGESLKSARILDKDKGNGLTKYEPVDRESHLVTSCNNRVGNNTGNEITEARQTTETEDFHNISVLPNQNNGTQARRIRLKKHGMSTRSSKRGDKKLDKYQAKMKKNTSGKGTNVEWNLDDRITTMIEEGVKRGYDLKGGGKNTTKSTNVEQSKGCRVVEGTVQSRIMEDSHLYLEEEIAKDLWDFILKAQRQFPSPWVMGGDFNVILDPMERVGVGSNMGGINSFKNFILQAQVIDIPLQGMTFTWSNNRSQEAWAQLDRFLVSPEILLWFPQLTQKGLEMSLSDHNPIMLGEPKEDWDPCPFRCYNSWLEDKNIMNEAVKGWKNCEVRGSKGFLLFSKLKASKQNMKTWLMDKRNSKMTSKDIEGQLEAID